MLVGAALVIADVVVTVVVSCKSQTVRIGTSIVMMWVLMSSDVGLT